MQTADERILPNGTAYLTDAGMTGPHDSIIGMEREPALSRFLTGLPSKFEPATGNPRLNGVIVDADDATGSATGVTRVSYGERDLAGARRHRHEHALRPAVRGAARRTSRSTSAPAARPPHPTRSRS